MRQARAGRAWLKVPTWQPVWLVCGVTFLTQNRPTRIGHYVSMMNEGRGAARGAASLDVELIPQVLPIQSNRRTAHAVTNLPIQLSVLRVH